MIRPALGLRTRAVIAAAVWPIIPSRRPVVALLTRLAVVAAETGLSLAATVMLLAIVAAVKRFPFATILVRLSLIAIETRFTLTTGVIRFSFAATMTLRAFAAAVIRPTLAALSRRVAVITVLRRPVPCFPLVVTAALTEALRWIANVAFAFVAKLPVAMTLRAHLAALMPRPPFVTVATKLFLEIGT